MSIIWGYILEAPGRPPLAKQREVMRALGVDMSEFGTCWHDKITKGSTRPRSQLTGRNDLLLAVMEGDKVVIAAPLCLGLSERDAAWLLAELAERKVEVTVNGDLDTIKPGDDHSDMLRRVASAHNVHHVRVAKAKARAKSK
ncbi:hypothetical protein [Alloyangia pacifica]|uniref:Resolvase/invertase-type recombinase catalytic domain-containing protein n=1 Tax=Alloyangia pacifica TaxID=311180 RepID=A0A1I6QL68_9RHOB|nr:hypothetical protein [Alloyangia pacifica]SDF92322.1 hypothetical protein SAMN04488245_101145 [Alloyangia pacifica]SFS53191.1 hypothetical protein SAMN04488050_102146 [Alloyangia pacifica]